jgi:hypoxanthine phosphoribosyltransferase
VDTVLDTGHTLRAIDATLRPRGPASLRYCVLLAKQRPGPPPFAADYVGFTIPDRFVVGYGLDYAQRYRNLPCVAVLRPEVYVPGGPNTG